MPKYFPIESNEVISSWMGQDTPLIRTLKRAYAGGLMGQRKFLMSLSQVKPLWEKKSLKDLSRIEGFKWFRNQILSDWRKSPAARPSDEVEAHITELASGIARENDPEVERLLAGARSFLRRAQ